MNEESEEERKEKIWMELPERLTQLADAVVHLQKANEEFRWYERAPRIRFINPDNGMELVGDNPALLDATKREIQKQWGRLWRDALAGLEKDVTIAMAAVKEALPLYEEVFSSWFGSDGNAGRDVEKS